MTASQSSPSCELCEAARITPWYYEDDECWIAECEGCFVPMVVWKTHDPHPDEDTKDRLKARLTAVASEVMDTHFWIDDVLRTIPEHYHAHARRRWS